MLRANILCIFAVVSLNSHVTLCKQCCKDDETFSIDRTECVYNSASPVQGNENSVFRPIWRDITVLCENTALSSITKAAAHVAILTGDVRKQLMKVIEEEYCTDANTKFTIENLCHSRTISLVKNNTMVVSKQLSTDGKCGPTFRYCTKTGEAGKMTGIMKCCGPDYSYNADLDCVGPLGPGENFHELTLPKVRNSTNGIPGPEPLAGRDQGSGGIRITVNPSEHGPHPGLYCTETMQLDNGTSVTVTVRQKAKHLATSLLSVDLTLLTFETVFMLATFFVHLVLPQFRNLPGKIVLLYTGTYLVWDFLRIFLALHKEQTAWNCFLRLVTLPYLKWSKCCWLFFFTMELLLRIYKIRLASPEQERKRLIAYCLTAWGVIGFLVLSICVTQGAVIHEFRISTESAGCTFLNRKHHLAATAFIVVTPCAVSCFVDLVLLVLVSKIIRRTSLALNTNQDHQMKRLQKRCKLLIRLYVLGVIKLIQSVVEILAIYLLDFELFRHLTLSIVQVIYAIGIFIIFCYKSSVKRQLCIWRRRLRRSSTDYSISRRGTETVQSETNLKSENISIESRN